MGTINVILGYLLNCSFTLLKGSFDKTSYYFCFKVSQKLKIIIIQNKKKHTHTKKNSCVSYFSASLLGRQFTKMLPFFQLHKSII